MSMTCPKCQAQMRQYERNGVTVDQCVECRGLFLDRGELERLIDAESAWHAAPQPQHSGSERGPNPAWNADSDEHHQYDRSGHGARPKRRSFLGELFD